MKDPSRRLGGPMKRGLAVGRVRPILAHSLGPSMKPISRVLLSLGGPMALLFGACVNPPPRYPDPFTPLTSSPPSPLHWQQGQTLLQGTIGASYLSDFSVSSSGS